MGVLAPQSGCATSAAGVFVLVNGGKGTATQASAATTIAYDLMFTLAGQDPPLDKSQYARG